MQSEETRQRQALSRRQFLAAAAVTAAAASLLSCRRTNPAPPTSRSKINKPPNIILLVTDDQRADTLSCSGNPILQTPHIDSLAANGTRFTNSFATTAICISSRASLLTGLNTRCHGIDSFDKPLPRPLFDNSYPILLRKAGYRTGFIGKWGLGGPLPIPDYDYFHGFSDQGFYFEPGNPKHLTVRQADQAVEFLHTTTHNQPFCLAVSFKAPHPQDEGRDQPGIYPKYPYDLALKNLYADASIPPPLTVDAIPMPAFFDQTINRTREGPDFHPDNYQEAIKCLYRLLAGVDQAVGRILAAVKDIGAQDNTVILYTADHASFYGEHNFGGKWLGLEEAIRTPCILFDPRHPQHAAVCDQTVLNVDIAPTLMDLANIPIPPAVQGQTILPFTTEGPVTPHDREWFYDHPFGHGTTAIPPSQGIRTSNWKYLRYVEREPLYEQLFDLQSDPREQYNRATDPAYEPILQHLRQRWSTWKTALDQATPTRTWTDPA